MAENDIYNNKEKHEYFKANHKLFALEPDQRPSKNGSIIFLLSPFLISP